jgi:uncharacterized Zn-binding protein involved in type VI secretion
MNHHLAKRILIQAKERAMSYPAVVLSIVTLVLVAACGGHNSHATSGGNTSQAALLQAYSAPEAKVGDRVVCPVTRNPFAITSSSLFVNVQGKKVYVCCADCKDPIAKNPDQYLKVGTNTAADHNGMKM